MYTHKNVPKIFHSIVLTLWGLYGVCMGSGNIYFEHPVLLIYIDKLMTDDIISIRFCQMCSHQATCPRISGLEYMDSRLQYTKHSMANNTLEKFHALLIMATFYGRRVLEGCV